MPKTSGVSLSSSLVTVSTSLTLFPTLLFPISVLGSLSKKAINIAKSYGYHIEPLNINTSGVSWEVSEDGTTFIQPLTSVKGLGDSAIEQIFKGRPFQKVEDFLFNENMRYSKLNKKALDVLTRSGALNCLMDDRFTGRKHFWSAIAVDRPRKPKNLDENITLYEPEGDFTKEEEIQFLVELTGQFPISKVITQETLKKLDEMYIVSQSRSGCALSWYLLHQLGNTLCLLKLF